MKVYWGWVVCPSFLLLFTLCAGVAFSFAEVMIPLNREIHESVALLGWVGALPASLPMLLAPIGTYLNYKLGTRRTVIIGVFITSMALALTALVNSVGLLMLTYGILVGLGLILIVNPPFFLLDEYFPYDHHRHVLATSIIACGFPLATLIFNPVTYLMLAHLTWRITYSIFAVTVFVLGSLTALTFRHKNKLEDDPAYTAKVMAKAHEEQNQQHVDEAPTADDFRNEPLARRTKIIMGTIWFIVSTLKSMGYYTPFVTLVKQMDVLGIPQSESSKAMSVVGGCELFSRLVTSYLGDYIKGHIMSLYVVCTLALCLQNALGSIAYSYSHIVAYAAALGLFGGPVIAAMYSSCSEVLGGQHVPALFTVFRVGLGLGALLGPTLAGFIFDSTNSFLGVFYVNSATYFVTSVLYATIILLNKYRPRWCFPDGSEELSLVNNSRTNQTNSQIITSNQIIMNRIGNYDFDSDSEIEMMGEQVQLQVQQNQASVKEQTE